MLVAIFVTLIASSVGGFLTDDTQGANLYIDWILLAAKTSTQSHLDPLLRENFQPINGNHRDVSVRFVRSKLKGLGEFRRKGDCNVTRSLESNTREIVCQLSTELRFNGVMNVTYQGVTKPEVAATALFYGVNGPVTMLLKGWKTLSVKFSPRYDGAQISLGESKDCGKNAAVCHEFYTQLIHLFEYATQKVFVKAILNGARRVPSHNQ
ncbi:hypothetical protein ISCGN_004254 [Ixodes scapularis]